MPTAKATSTVEAVPDRRSAIDFSLTDRALRFAQNYAEHPSWGVTVCAKKAGYSDRGRAAHVRGCELLRDQRVISAIIYLGSLELMKAQAKATSALRSFAEFGYLDSWTVRLLRIDLQLLASRIDYLNRIMAKELE